MSDSSLPVDQDLVDRFNTAHRSRVWRRNCPQGHRDDGGSHDRPCICDHSYPFRSGKRSISTLAGLDPRLQIRPNCF